MCETRNSSLLGKITVCFVICSFGVLGLCVNTAAALDGSGTEADPWRIESLTDFNEFAADANYWDDYTRLETDVNLAGLTYTTAVIAPDSNNVDSGFQGTPFTGVFDGNDHKIINLTIDDAGAGNDYLGLFGHIDEGEVSNLGLEAGSVSGTGRWVGGLCGANRSGTITECNASGSVKGSHGLGGLCGWNSGTISDCYATGSVTGGHHSWHLGGLCGMNFQGTINNSYVTGSVTGGHHSWHLGGLCGGNYYDGAISNCHATGSVTGGDYSEALGGLCGANGDYLFPLGGTISDCYSTGSVRGGDESENLGGLCGYNYYGTISDCDYRTAKRVQGGNESWNLGGLCGYNNGTISNCYSSGGVQGRDYSKNLGGLCGKNYGTISDCHAIGSVGPVRVGYRQEGYGLERLGGLCGLNSGTITNCYATGYVEGLCRAEFIGGLCGKNYGTISDCYANGDVTGDLMVDYCMGYYGLHFSYYGGLCGENYRGTISNCYATGKVMIFGEVVRFYSYGGFCGSNYYGTISNCFWDIETSGQTTSDGGTGLPTDEMQTMSTFTNVGWDFFGETYNGIDDIWFIPQQDYPHLSWEGMQVPMKLTPRTLNCRSEGNWVKAHLTLPEGFTVANVDSDRPAVLHSFGFDSAPLHVFVNKDKLVQIEAAFERQTVCSLAGNWPDELSVAVFLTDGNIFLGTSTVRIIHPGMKVIEELAWYWLNADCVHPDFCNDIDMNRDSIVNLLDYALLMNINVEFVTDE